LSCALSSHTILIKADIKAERQREMVIQEETISVPVAFPMRGGEGPQSYSQNSTLQQKIVEAAKERVEKAIEDSLEFTNPSFFRTSKTLCMADFGCSTGPNTFLAMQNVMEAAGLKYQSQNQADDHPPLEFQVFFNDHVSNDFNTLFRNLPSSSKYFAAGVPGSFHNRLFPKASLHIGHCSYALHWLSKVPEEVMDVNSPAWNKDTIHPTGLSKEVEQAYKAQFQNDMETFLNARAHELVGGGLLLLTFPCVPDGFVNSQMYFGFNNDLLGHCLADMANEGLISKEKVESFNIPIYNPPVKVLEASVKRNAYFSVERFESIANGKNILPDLPYRTMSVRAVMEDCIKAHFGEEITNSVFERFAKKLSHEIYAEKVAPENIFVVLKRVKFNQQHQQTESPTEIKRGKMASQDTVPSKSWAMNGGDGPNSYAQNSFLQKSVVDGTKGLISDGIAEKLDFMNSNFDSSGLFVIADFGSSVGPNTFFAVANIIEAVEQTHQSQLPNAPPLDFQVFFNDVTDNDFNTLFKTLPSHGKYFAAGVPGTFYGRLFPKSFLHFGHSSSALLWLSKIPEEIVDPNSPSWNKGSIYCSGTNKEVLLAYSNQFQRDMDAFLNARAQEIIGGGLMAILIPALPENVLMSQIKLGLFYEFLGSCLADMGVIGEEEVDSFNIPMYFSSSKEMEEIIKRNGHFSIEAMDPFEPHMIRKELSVEVSISVFRAACEGVLKGHFGNEEIVEKIFQYTTQEFAKRSIFDGLTHESVVLAVMEDCIKAYFGEEITNSVFERFAKKLSYEIYADKVAPENIFVKSVVDTAKRMISEGIADKLDFTNSNNFDTLSSFVIADFGSSVGPNTFFAVANIIEAVEQKHHSQLPDAPSLNFQVFFNDVTDNDFNTLFKNLPSHPKYFAAGVPGTFYGRLFPKSFLHFAHSSSALHWLSKIPEEIVDPNSPSWNKGSIYCSGTNKEVLLAYSNQFQRDMNSFLNARAQEIIGGGLMAIIIPALPENVLMSQIKLGLFYEFLGSCLADMGVIGDEEVDSFNIPMYFSSSKEIEEIIKSNSYFSIERMNPFEHPMIRKEFSVEVSILAFRAACEGVLKGHFGNEGIVEKIFQYITQEFAKRSIFDGLTHESVVLSVLLKRNVD
ncbi:hypothetical protein Tsubulata_003957, partial [Turnera subulata]